MTVSDNLLQEGIDSVTVLSSHFSITGLYTFYATPADYSTADYSLLIDHGHSHLIKSSGLKEDNM